MINRGLMATNSDFLVMFNSKLMIFNGDRGKETLLPLKLWPCMDEWPIKMVMFKSKLLCRSVSLLEGTHRYIHGWLLKNINPGVFSGFSLKNMWWITHEFLRFPRSWAWKSDQMFGIDFRYCVYVYNIYIYLYYYYHY